MCVCVCVCVCVSVCVCTYIITQHLPRDRVWHDVNLLAEYCWFSFRVFLLLYWLSKENRLLYLIYPLLGVGINQVLNPQFSFLSTGCLMKAKSTSLPYNLLIAGSGKNRQVHAFLNGISVKWTQITSSSILTVSVIPFSMMITVKLNPSIYQFIYHR